MAGASVEDGAVRKLRSDALAIFRTALEAVAAERLVSDVLAKEGDRIFGRARTGTFQRGSVYLFGAGKAAEAMARGVERSLGRRLAGGLIITKPGEGRSLRRTQVAFGSHPRPGVRSVSATRRIMRSLRGLEIDGRVLFVWSGGASSLLVHPRSGILLSEKIETLAGLMDAGADIHRINAVRKHLSAVKGGQLLRCLAGQPVTALVLSDVCGDDPSTIGSGPTFPDNTSFAEAIEALREFKVWSHCPASVRVLLRAGVRGEIAENPGRRDRLVRRVETIVVGTSRNALDAAVRRSRRLGYRTLIVGRQLQGDTATAARLHAEVAASFRGSTPCCLISGGETTVDLPTGHGRGGRNQHFVLAAALEFTAKPQLQRRRWVVQSCGTDGSDGPTDAAGAVADTFTLLRAAQRGKSAVDFLRRRDSYAFFRSLGDLIVTGPTGTNVMDLRVVLLGPAGS